MQIALAVEHLDGRLPGDVAVNDGVQDLGDVRGQLGCPQIIPFPYAVHEGVDTDRQPEGLGGLGVGV